jgi:hypothetical protein
MEGRKDHMKLWSRTLVCGFPHAKTNAKAVTPEFATAFGKPEATAGEEFDFN